MLLSELLKHVPHVQVHYADGVGDEFTVKNVRTLDDLVCDCHAIRWSARPDPKIRRRSQYDGVVIVPFPHAGLLGYTTIVCDDPKASIIAAINALVNAKVIRIPELVTDGMSCQALDHIMRMMIRGELSVGYNTTIGGPGFGYHKGQRFPHIGSVRIGHRVEIGSNTCIDRGTIGDTVIGDDTKIGNLVHIAHNARIGHRCTIVCQSGIGGSAIVEDDVYIGFGAKVKNKVRIGAGAIIGMGAVVITDVPPGETWAGNPARCIRLADGSRPTTTPPSSRAAGGEAGQQQRGDPLSRESGEGREPTYLSADFGDVHKGIYPPNPIPPTGEIIREGITTHNS